MYTIIQNIRHRLPFLWTFIESANAALFRLRYGRNLKLIPQILSKYSDNDVSYSIADNNDAPKLALFFQRQPNEAFKYFRPHEFDEISIRKLIGNPSFIMIIAKCNSEIAGYSFLRCFANGKAFRGKIVDIDFRGRGLAKKIGFLTTEITSCLGLSLFGTISRSNISSMESSKSSNEIKILKELSDNYLLIQYLPKRTYIR